MVTVFGNVHAVHFENVLENRIEEITKLGMPLKKKTAYFMASGKLGFCPTYPTQIETK